MAQIAKRTLLLGHSPDPDDAFMFYALAKEKIDTRGWKFEHVLQDIQTLNERAMRGELDITAISIHAYAYVASNYALLRCGASMGLRYGPMIVAREAFDVSRLRELTVAVPGTMTSAFLALKLYIGEFPYEVVPFDEIIPAVQAGRYDAGLIIHEGQLTYGAAGLHKLLDLGEWWWEQTHLPLPLGGNAVRRDLGEEAIREISEIVRESIQYGLDHREEAVRYALQWARDMDTSLADQFIGMYVNDLTLDYGPTGCKAVEEFLRRAEEKKLVPRIPELVFY